MSTMASGPRLLALCGSLRGASYNRRLLAVAAAMAAEQGARVEELDLRALTLPPYDGDLEAAHGLPPDAQVLKERIGGVDGVLIACPEYNNSVPGWFKNAIDWTSRGEGAPWRGRTVALMGTSPGPTGAARSLNHLCQALMHLGAWVVPTLVAIPRAGEAFDEAGALRDEAQQQRLAGQLRMLIDHL